MTTKFNKKKQSDENEQTVCDLLNQFKNSSFKVSTDPYSRYDIIGKSDGIKTLVEVKLRDKDWAKPFIEQKKLDDLFALGKSVEDDVNYILVNSIEPTGEHYAYCCKHIYQNGRRYSKEMNKTTAFGSTEKVSKDVIEFSKGDYMVELTTQEIGFKYEVN